MASTPSGPGSARTAGRGRRARRPTRVPREAGLVEQPGAEGVRQRQRAVRPGGRRPGERHRSGHAEAAQVAGVPGPNRLPAAAPAPDHDDDLRAARRAARPTAVGARPPERHGVGVRPALDAGSSSGGDGQKATDGDGDGRGSDRRLRERRSREQCPGCDVGHCPACRARTTPVTGRSRPLRRLRRPPSRVAARGGDPGDGTPAEPAPRTGTPEAAEPDGRPAGGRGRPGPAAPDEAPRPRPRPRRRPRARRRGPAADAPDARRSTSERRHPGGRHPGRADRPPEPPSPTPRRGRQPARPPEAAAPEQTRRDRRAERPPPPPTPRRCRARAATGSPGLPARRPPRPHAPAPRRRDARAGGRSPERPRRVGPGRRGRHRLRADRRR